MVGKALVRLVLVVPLLVAGLALDGPRGVSAAEVCGDGGTYEEIGGTVKTDVIVPTGATCIIADAVVRGGLTVGPGGYVEIIMSEVRGSVTGSNIFRIDIRDTVVRGSVTVAGGENVGVVGDKGVTEVRGDVRISGLTSAAFVSGVRVRGSVVLDGIAGIQVQDNAIGVNLACTNIGLVNSFSGRNTVGGTATGPCAGLVGP